MAELNNPPFARTHDPKVDKDEMMAAIPSDCSEQSDKWYHPGIEAWAGKEFLDNFSLRPADPENYDVASHPKS